MAVYKVKTTITGVFTSMDLVLDGKDIDLSYDGDHTYASTDLFDLSDKLGLQWAARGLSFQDYTITLAISKRNDDGSFAKPKNFEEDGTIPQGQVAQVHREISPESPDHE
ncbi:MAG TPA: hypothetical protein VFP59_16840 [Candidatus Angelobacter sp.]|nr:hypothetical protein [Candidatus Angelobacter sp.]